MIKSFGNDFARAAWERRFAKGIPNDVLKVANRKLTQLNSARNLNDLKAPPGNRLERLAGDRRRQYSICVNDHWRICFRWEAGDAHNVEIIDYH